MNSAVPNTLPAIVCPRLPKSRAMPKSESFTSPSAVSSRLPGLMSRWIDAAVVGVAEGLGHLDADPQHFAPGEDPPAAQLRFQAAAGDQFHGVEEVVALLAEAEEADDVRMIELAEGLDFGLEALAEVGLVDEGLGEELDGGRLAALGVDPFIDGAHAAAAEFPPDSVGT